MLCHVIIELCIINNNHWEELTLNLKSQRVMNATGLQDIRCKVID
jgi:hypothetical protein